MRAERAWPCAVAMLRKAREGNELPSALLAMALSRMGQRHTSPALPAPSRQNLSRDV